MSARSEARLPDRDLQFDRQLCKPDWSLDHDGGRSHSSGKDGCHLNLDLTLRLGEIN